MAVLTALDRERLAMYLFIFLKYTVLEHFVVCDSYFNWNTSVLKQGLGH